MMDNQRLRAIILDIEYHLSDEDRKRLHFYVGDVVPRRLRDDPSLAGTLNIMEKLIEERRISENDLTFLIDAFDQIHCMNAVELLKEYQKVPHAIIEQPYEAGVSDRNQKTLLEEMIEDDKISSFSTPLSVPVGPVYGISSSIEHFQLTSSSGISTKTNIESPEKSTTIGKKILDRLTFNKWQKIIFLCICLCISCVIGISVAIIKFYSSPRTPTPPSTSGFISANSSRSTTSSIMSSSSSSVLPTSTTSIMATQSNSCWQLIGNMILARYAHTSTFVQETNSILIAGGHDYSTSYRSTESFDLSKNISVARGDMSSIRYYHTADRLTSGLILLSYGHANTTDLFDPYTGTVNRTTYMRSTLSYHTSSLIYEGNSVNVLLAGGLSSIDCGTADVYRGIDELFIPVKNSMSACRKWHTSTSLPTGEVVIAGGFNDSMDFDTLEMYRPDLNKFVPLNVRMSDPRRFHTATYIRSQQSILYAGGFSGKATLNTFELFNVVQQRFLAKGTMLYGRYRHTATVLHDGRVLLVGGYDGDYVGTSEIYDPSTGKFSSGATMNVARRIHTATLILNTGNVVVCGGQGLGRKALQSCEVYRP